MKSIWYNLVLVLLLFSCNSSSKKSTIQDFIYNEAEIVLTINNIENFKSNSNNNHFIEQLSKTKPYKTITKKLSYITELQSNNSIYISLFTDASDSLQYSFVTKTNDSLFKLDSIKMKRETIALKSFYAEKMVHKNLTLFLAKKDSLIIGSSTKAHLETLFNNKTDNNSIKKIIATQSKNGTFSVYINKNSKLKTVFKNKNLAFDDFTNYLTFDAEVLQDELILNGVTKAIDSSQSLINVFKNTIPQNNQLAQITPSNSAGFLSITFNDFKTFNKNLINFTKTDSISSTTLFDNIIEFGEIYNSNSNAIILNSLDPYITKEALVGEKENTETFRDVSIYNFSDTTLFYDYLHPFIQQKEVSKYCILDNFIVFSNSTETLENIIVNYQNQTTFSNRDYYQKVQTHLSDQASVLQVLNPSSLENLLNTNLKSDASFEFSTYKTSALQFIVDGDFAHFNTIVKQTKDDVSENSISELFNIKLDNDVLNTPQFVKNHRTKQLDIVVQDVSNTLYLISNKGKILWKKQLNGPVLGKIEQIDMYKNGRLQLAFATPKRVYVLDRKGNNVNPFPLKFNDEITHPLSVFDYDKKKNYRLFVTQGKNVLLYDGKGKTVKGFKFKSAKNQLNTQPKHIKIGGKDYLVFKTKKQLYILNRRGSTRVKPKTSPNYANQPVYEYNKSFITTTLDGKLATIDQKGNVVITNKNLTEAHTLTSTTKTMVTQSEHLLNIKDNTLELDFGNYTPAKLFVIKNKIYVTTTDLQTQKVMLFDSNAKTINNFPVYGTSAIDLDNIDADNRLEFVTKGENNSILAYKIN